mgnify:CR=1 FL=1
MIKNLICIFALLFSLKSFSETKEWSVFIFMAGDNDLSSYAVKDMMELERFIPGEKNLGSSTKKVNIVVEMKNSFSAESKRFLVKQQRELKFLNIPAADIKDDSFIHSPVISSGTGDNQEERFKNFLSWGIQNYPAKKYAIIIWGHGEGYIGKTEDHSQKTFGGVAFDNSSNTFIDIPTLKEILKETQTNLLNNKAIDLLIFDACLMQSIEVALELSDVASFLIGSVQIQDYLGLPYRKLADFLNQTPSPSAHTVATSLPTIYKQSVLEHPSSRRAESFESFTLSSLNMGDVKQILKYDLKNLKKAVTNYLLEDRFRELTFRFMIEDTPQFLGGTVDIGILMGMIKEYLYNDSSNTLGAKNLLKAVNNVLDALNRSVLSYQFGPMYLERRTNPRENYLRGFFKGISWRIPENFLSTIEKERRHQFFK